MMRYSTSLLLGLVACSDSPIDPDDPLIGTWLNATSTGQYQWPGGRVRWTFGADGSYETVTPRVTPGAITSDLEAGTWDRGVDRTIRLCPSHSQSCDALAELTVLIEGGRLLINGRSIMNGEWYCEGEGACQSNGSYHDVSWMVTMHADGTAAQRIHVCDLMIGIPTTYQLTGTWTTMPTFLEATFSDPRFRPVRCPRIGDTAAGVEYSRSSS